MIGKEACAFSMAASCDTLPGVSSAPTEPIIVCPLAFERDALTRRGVRGRLLCIGPGEAGIERLDAMIDGQPSGPVILAGLAGALDGACMAGSAWVISEVIGESGARWRPTWPRESRSATATIATSHQVLASPQMKCEFAERTGAQLVDQESGPFSRVATQRGWTWGIIRGVSDDLSTSLPPDIHNWVTAAGHTRTMRAAVSCLLRPRWIGTLVTLHRNGARAMGAVSDVLRESILSR